MKLSDVCPLCESSSVKRVYPKYPQIVECSDCGLAFATDLYVDPSAFYQTYADGSSHMKMPEDWQSGKWFPDHPLCRMEFFDDQGVWSDDEDPDDFSPVFDVGCGWGAALMYFKKAGLDVMGCEICRKMADWGNERLGIRIIDAPFMEIAPEHDTQGLLTMFHVMEHIPRPRDVAARVFDWLKPGGVFTGIVPNWDSLGRQVEGDRWYWLDPNYHCVFFNKRSLTLLFETIGFEDIRMSTARGDYDEARHQGNIGRAGRLPSKFEGEELRFFARKP